MIIDIRGTHGSGKSHTVHQLLARYSHEKTAEGTLVPELGLFILGHYDRACGGCDGISTAARVTELVRWGQGAFRHVMLEGILVAHTFKRYRDLALEFSEYRFYFLDTPLDKCIENVRKRIAARGKDPEAFDPKNVIKDYGRIWNGVRLKLYEELPDRVYVVNSNQATDTVLGAMRDA